MSLLNRFIVISVFSSCMQISMTASAFNNNFDINHIDMVEENFLDIKAHRFRKSLDYQWYDSTTAWRMNGASLDGDLTFLQTEIKLHHVMSDYINVRLETEQEVFYASEDFPALTTEVEFYPVAGNIGFSLLGTPTYEKRDIDMGAALLIGRRPWNFTRLEALKVDALYNDKNSIDNTRYSDEPWRWTLEGHYLPGKYKVRFRVSQEDHLQLLDPDQDNIFDYDDHKYFLLVDYLPGNHRVYGITINGFSINKQNNTAGSIEKQETEYYSADVYTVTGLNQSYEYRVGIQYDYLSNRIRNQIKAADNLDYHFDTLQLYSTMYHPFNDQMAWDIGLHLGDVEEEHHYFSDTNRNNLNEGFQGKLRMGYIYRSADQRSYLQLNLSLDIDDLFNGPTDGGGISFQSVF